MHFVHTKLLLWMTGILLAKYLPKAASANTKTTIDNTLKLQAATAQFISDSSAFDGPKVRNNNITSIDWWYFDAVSQHDNQSIVIVFYVATDLGFFALDPDGSALSVDIFASWDDGIYEYIPVDDAPGSLGKATITTDGDGASGTWSSTGWSFTGTPDLSRYTVNVNNVLNDIHGTFTLDSVSNMFTILPIVFLF
jgi:hypothetical protein